MVVKAWLEGHPFDLDELVALLPVGDTRVIKDGAEYYLVSAEIDSRPAAVPFYEVAPRLLERVNGLGRLHNPSYRPVKLSGRYQDGDRRHTVVVLGTAEARCGALAATVVVNGAEAARPPSPGPDQLHLASNHPDVAEALALMGQPQSLGWVEMWKVFEIVRENIKPATVESLGWPIAGDVKAFTASANRPDVSGQRARHARMTGGPPRRSMSERSGREFVGSLVAAWLSWLAAASKTE